MDYMKKMPTVLEAVGIRTKDVHNVFMSHSDSGYSTQTTNSCVNDGVYGSETNHSIFSSSDMIYYMDLAVIKIDYTFKRFLFGYCKQFQVKNIH